MNRKGLTLIELLAIILILGILAAILLPVLSNRRERKRRAACADNLKQLGVALNLYVNENKDRYPPVDDTKNNFMFDANLMYPEYLSDHMMAMCPVDPRRDPDSSFRLISDHSIDGTPKGEVHPDCITGDSYIYLSWMVMDDKEATAFFKAYDDLSPNDYDTDITVPESRGTLRGDTIHRLHVGVDRFLIVDTNVHIQGAVPGTAVIAFLWDRPHKDPEKFSHRPVGGNVLYLDGHVDYYSLDRDLSPMTETMARLLDERPREAIAHCE